MRFRAIAVLTLGAALLLPALPAAGAVELLSQGRPVSASSVENADYTPARAAVDGDPGTRWSSARTDDEWLQVDLGASARIDRIELDWETAHAKAYDIQLSDSPTGGWRTVHTERASTGGDERVTVSGTGRYLRLQGRERIGGYGYSLWELRVFGETGATSPSPTPTPTPTPTSTPSPSPTPSPTGSGGPVDPGYPNEPGPLTGPSVVKVTGGNGSWQLQVNGKPYSVKGFTWGPKFTDAAQYMPGFTAMGANTTRVWGTGEDTRQLLDVAAANGVRVIVGFWLVPGAGPGANGCIRYTDDTAYKNQEKAAILKWVETYRSHPGTLMWSVGNESILGLQNCYSGSDLEAQRVAYAKFVNEVTREIHRIDPNHPVTTSDARTNSWPYFRDHAPDLDLLAINAYGDACGLRDLWEDGDYGKPYILTEGGAAGEWEVPNDANGVPTEPSDLAKGQAYVDSWRCIIGHRGVGLGATFFHYGIEGDFGGVWFNVIPGGNKRLGYYQIAEAWGRTGFANTPPRIASMAIPRSGSVVSGSTVEIDIEVSDPNGDPLRFVTGINSKYIDNAGGIQIVDHTRVDGNTVRIAAPQRIGVWKAYVFVEDGRGNVGVETKSFRVVPPPVAGTNVGLGKAATSSPYQTWGANYSPGQAFDGDFGTRWSSEWGPSASIQVDLGAVTSFDQVQLVWEAAYAKSYALQTSTDGSTWTTVREVTDGNGNNDDLTVSARGRYVRLQLTERGLPDYGYSLFEVGLYRTS